MTAAQDLRIRINEYTETVANLDIMLTNLNAELADTNAEILTIDNGVLDASTADHEARLEAKRVSNGWDYVMTYSGYGIINLEDDWEIYTMNGAAHSAGITRLSDDSFRVSGLTFPTYTVNTPIKALPGSIIREVYSTVVVAAVSTTVTLYPGTALPNPLTRIDQGNIVYEYLGTGWDSDAGILAAQGAFNTGYGQINDSISASGTYGLDERVTNLTLGISVQTANRAAYQSFIDDYEQYAA